MHRARARLTDAFPQDTHDLFATLMVSLEFSDRTRFFRTYPNSFTTDEAAANLASLRFSQSNRAVDPKDPSRIVTTTTTTTFSMSREIAKGICQHFMDARLIENAADPASQSFKDRGIYQITPKGLHLLERFITRNGIVADHLVKLFTSHSIAVKIHYLERRAHDDEIYVSRQLMERTFRAFAGGRHPNYATEPIPARVTPLVARPFNENARSGVAMDGIPGVELQDVVEKSKAGLTVVRQVLSSLSAVDWLVDCTTCCSRDEAAEVMAHFVRYGLVTLYVDRSRAGDKVLASYVYGSSRATPDDEFEFRYGPRILYRITEDGRKAAQRDAAALATTTVTKGVSGLAVSESPAGSSPGGQTHSSSSPAQAVGSGLATSASNDDDDDASSTRSSERQSANNDRSFAGGTGLSNFAESQIAGRQAIVDLFRADFSEAGGAATWAKDQHSTTARLRAILDEPALRSLFRDFLRQNYCDENLGFYLDVADFRRRFATMSSVGGAHALRKKAANASHAMESHQQSLANAALAIYNTYLAPLSPMELNIDHNLRADVVNYVTRALQDAGASPTTTLSGTASRTGTFGSAAGGGGGRGSPRMSESSGGGGGGVPGLGDSTHTHTGSSSPQSTPALRATQVQTMLKQYERIQDHVFRLLATDQVPRFIRCASLCLFAHLPCA